MRYEVTLPSLGDEDDTVTEAQASQWLAKKGDVLEEGDDLLEIVTDKAAFVVPVPKASAYRSRRHDSARLRES